MENILKIKNNPVWVKFKKFYKEFENEFTVSGLPGYKLEQFSKNLPNKEKEYIEDFLSDLNRNNYIKIDAKKRIFVTEKAKNDLF